MKRTLAFFRSLVILIVLLAASRGAHASHVLGADLYYTWLSGDTYEITLVLYGDCSGSSFSQLQSTAPQICIKRGTTQVATISLAIQAPTAGVDITPVCPGAGNTTCQSSSSSIPGIKKFVYKANYTLPAPTVSNCWQFCYLGGFTSGTNSGRSNAITNITGPGGTSMQLVDTLDNSVHPNNSSAQFTVIPTPFFCINTPSSFNPGCVDPNGDVLDIALIPAKNGPGSGCNMGGNVTYTGTAWTPPATPVSGATPLRVVAGSFNFNPSTGQLNFTPNAIQRATVVYNVREFRGGVFVGNCQREMNFLVQNCTNPPPGGGLDSTTGGAINGTDSFVMCTNSGPFSLYMNPTAAVPTNSITVTWTGLPAGAVINVVGNGTRTPHVTFSWTSNGVAPGLYVVYMTFTDNNCPLAGTTTKAITINITPVPTIITNIVAPATCVRKAAVNIVPGGTGAPWTITVSGPPPASPPHTLTGVMGAVIDSLLPGTYVLNISSAVASACNSSATVTIVATPTTPGLTSNSPVCQDSTLRLYATDTGSGLSYSWQGPNGFSDISQNPVLTPATLAASGVYTLTVTNALTGCVTSDVISVTIKPSPAVPVVTSNAPICDGAALNLHAASNSGATYSWNGPGGFTSNVQHPVISPASTASTGSYTVVATLAGCPSLPGVGTFTVFPIPPAPMPIDTSYCQKEMSGPLTAIGDNLLWYTSGTGAPAAPVPFTDTMPGIYSWNVTQTINNCESPQAQVNVEILYVPVFTVAGRTPICIGDSIVLAYSGPPLNNPTYSWTLPANTMIVDGIYDAATAYVRFDTANTQRVTLEAGNYNGRCRASATIPVVVQDPPMSDFYVKPEFCIGDTVLVALTSRTEEAKVFTWDFDGGTVVSANSNSGGPYRMFWTDPGKHIIKMTTTSDIGCKTPPVFDTFNVRDNPSSTILINGTNGPKYCVDDTITLYVKNAEAPNKYTWAPEHSFKTDMAPLSDNNSIVRATLEANTNGTGRGTVEFTVTVTDPFGCSSEGKIDVAAESCCNVVFPNAFSPNGDTHNDVFRPLSQAAFKRYHVFRIVNRWGQPVFQSSNSNDAWDGTMNGVPQEVGVYFYYLKYDCNGKTMEEKGDVTLVR